MGKYKIICSEEANIKKERDLLKNELEKNESLTDKLSADFKLICKERDCLYERVRSLQSQLNEVNESQNDDADQRQKEIARLKEQINEINDINFKQFAQIELLNKDNKRIQIQYTESQNRYVSIMSDFKCIKSKYSALNSEYDKLSKKEQKIYVDMQELREENVSKMNKMNEAVTKLSAARTLLQNELN